MDEVANVERLASELYGAAAKLPVRGVLHVVSAFEHTDGYLHVIKIGPQAPQSSSDFFVLNYWRAHADAILTSAAVVRAEPKLSHELQGEHAAELAIYRARCLNKREPPLCAILTGSGALPDDHPVWRDRARNHVLTSPERAPALQTQLGSRAGVVGIEQLSVVRAIEWLHAQGAACVLIEAGPTTANQLYADRRGVDHLMLSRCRAPVPAAACGGALAPPSQLFAGLNLRAQTERREESGPWRFERWDRASK
jgi:riboflavin biosynthesis pyrimidine reductase